jgi:hypothetical protein
MRALYRLRLCIHVPHSILITFKGKDSVAPYRQHDRQLLLEHVHAHADRRERETVRLVPSFMPAGAEPELDETCGYSVRGGDNLGEHRRVPPRHRRHERAQTQS